MKNKTFIIISSVVAAILIGIVAFKSKKPKADPNKVDPSKTSGGGGSSIKGGGGSPAPVSASPSSSSASVPASVPIPKASPVADASIVDTMMTSGKTLEDVKIQNAQDKNETKIEPKSIESIAPVIPQNVAVKTTEQPLNFGTVKLQSTPITAADIKAKNNESRAVVNPIDANVGIKSGTINSGNKISGITTGGGAVVVNTKGAKEGGNDKAISEAVKVAEKKKQDDLKKQKDAEEKSKKAKEEADKRRQAEKDKAEKEKREADRKTKEIKEKADKAAKEAKGKQDEAAKEAQGKLIKAKAESDKKTQSEKDKIAKAARDAEELRKSTAAKAEAQKKNTKPPVPPTPVKTPIATVMPQKAPVTLSDVKAKTAKDKSKTSQIDVKVGIKG
jgi:hypothetical protein